MSITRSFPVQIAGSQNTFVPAPKAIGVATSWSKISIGTSHTLALKSDGSLWGWGNNTYGQLMSGVVVTASSPVALSTTKSWSAISAGTNFSIALDNNNLLWGWGDNQYGQLGVSPNVGTNIWSNVALGLNTIVALRKDNTVWSWGYNANGGIGDGTTVNRSLPTQTLSDKTITKIFQGNSASFAIDNLSRLWAWGGNAQGQVGDGTTISRSSPVQVPGSWLTVGPGVTHTVAIRTDYTMWAWGINSAGGTLGDGTTISRSSPVQIGTIGISYVMVSAGYSQTYAIDSLGKMYGWGLASTYGAVGDFTTVSRSAPVQIGTGSSWTMVSSQTTGGIALDINRKVYSWGRNDTGQLGQNDVLPRSSPVQISSISTSSFTAIAAGALNGIALRLDGSLYSWGTNTNGQVGDSTTVNKSSPVLVATSVSGATLLQNPGSTGGQLGYLYNNILNLIAIGSNGSVPLLTYVGPLQSVSQSSPVQIATTYVLSPTQLGTSSWSAISAGGGHTLAIRTDNTLWNWGLGTSGQVSSDTIPNYFSKSSPVQVAGSWSSISAGGSHSTAINTDGQLYAWGDNTVTQLGVPQNPTNYSWIQIAGNDITTMAIRSDYTLWGWGYNNNGNIGDGTTISRSSPVQIGSDSWIFISLNATQSQGTGGASGIKSNGTLWSWGRNVEGQLGDGTTIAKSSPVQVLGGGSWSFVSSSMLFKIAIKAGAQAGQVWAWGHNTYGALGDNSAIAKSSPVQITAAGSSFTFVASGNVTSYAIKTDGTIFSWGYNANGEMGDGTTVNKSVPTLISSLGARVFTKIYSHGSSTAYAIQNNGKLWGWGLNTTGEIGDGTTVTRSSPVQVSGAQNWSTNAGLGPYTQRAGIDTSGKVYLWSSYNTNLITSSAYISNPTYYSWSQISVGPSHTVALREDGKVFAWGYNAVGQVGDATIFNRSSPVQIAGTGDEREYFVSVAAGTNFTIGVNVIGKLYAWGLNTYGQLGDNTVVLKSSPVLLTAASVASSSFVSVSAGDNHVIALTTAGTVFSWGTNGSGQLGQNDTVFRSSPVQIPSMTNIAQISAGASFSTALDTSGRLYTWGVNDAGQLGYGYDPVRSITGNGNSNIVILTAGGKLYGIGTNNYGQLGDSSTTARSSFVAVATQPNKTWSSVVMSSYFTLALATDGTLWAWGNNGAGQLGNNSTTAQSSPSQVGSSTDWRSISISGGTAYAINSAGGLYAWGYNADGQIGNNSTASLSNPTQIRSDLTWTEVLATENYFNVITYGNTVVHARTTSGNMYSWGYNNNGDVGDGTTISKSNPVQIGMGYYWSSLGNKHAIRGDGTLWGWGYGNVATVGDLTVASRSSPVQIGSPGSTAWDKIYGGVDQYNAGLSPYCCVFAIKADGTLWGWGNGNIFGLLGDGTTTARQSPIQLGATIDTGRFKEVFNLGTHVYALSGNDNLWAWGIAATAGINILGTGDATAKSSPVQITAHPGTGNPPYLSISTFYQYNATSSPVQVGTSSWTLVSAGYRHVAAIDINGRLFAWGDNTYGQIGTFLTNASFVTGVSGGSTATALLRISDSRVLMSGYNDYGQIGDNTTVAKSNPVQLLPYSPTTWKYISRAINRDSAGTTLAIDSKYNILYAWGYGGLGQLGDGTTLNRSSPVNIGGLVSGGGAQWVEAIAGNSFSVGIKTDGTIWGWGYGAAGNLGYVSWKQIAVNSINGYAIDSIGRLFAWGYGAAGSIGINDIAPRSSPVQIGTNVAWKSIAIPNLPANIFTGYVLALRSDNSLWSWGNNNTGQLGDGTVVAKSSPVLVSNGRGYASIAAGYSTAIAVDLEGKLWTWGQGASGELGDGTTATRSVPTLITADTSTWSSVTAGQNHVVAIRTNGNIWSWGLNTSGQLGDNTTVNKSSPVALTGGGSWSQVAAGYSHTIALKTDSTLWAWGNGGSGQLGQGTDATNRSSPVQVSSGRTVNSVAFNGTNLIQLPYDTQLTFGTGDFTIEGWFFHTGAQTTNAGLFSYLGSNYFVLHNNATSYLNLLTVWVDPYSASLRILTGTTTLLQKTWHHFAVTRASGVWRLWLNGTQEGTTYTNTAEPVPANATLRLGYGNNAGLTGYMSNFRIVKGQSLYSGTFTPATSNLTTSTVGATGAGAAGSLTGTVTLLALQSSTIRDNSSYANNMSPTSTVATTPPMNNAIPSTFTQTLVYESWTSIRSGGNTNLAIKQADNSVYGWGDNTNFQLLQTPTTFSWMMLSGRLGIKTDGTLWAWGGGDYGEMGQGDTLSRSSPTQIGTDNDWMWCGDEGPMAYAVAAIKSDYRAYVWGTNLNQVLGINENSATVAGRSSPVQLPGSWSQIKIGPANGVGLRVNGTVWTWGDANPNLGSNSIPAGQRSSPVQIQSADSFTQIAIGGDATYAIATTGRLWAWGYGTNGTIGDGVSVNRSSPVQIGTSTWSVVASIGYGATAAIDSIGRLFTWGAGDSGGLGSGSTANRASPVLIAVTGSSFTMVAGKDTYRAGVAGSGVARTIAGTYFVWGVNAQGQLGDNTTVNKSTPVAAFALANSTTGAQIAVADGIRIAPAGATVGLFATGRNNYGSVGDNTTVNRSSPVQISTEMRGILSPTMIFSAPYQGSNGFSTPTTSSFTAIGVGPSNAFVISSNANSLGTLWTWGVGTWGQLGDGTTIARSSPTQIAAGTIGVTPLNATSSPVQIASGSWSQVSIGQSMVFAIKSDYTLWTWGANNAGQLGDGSAIYMSSPIQISSGELTDPNAYSMYFQGGWLGYTITSGFALGSGDFTIELWVYPVLDPSGAYAGIMFSTGLNSAGKEIRISQNVNSYGLGFVIPGNNNTSDVTIGYGYLPLFNWYHIALTRSGSTVAFYRNGTCLGTVNGVSFNHTAVDSLRIAYNLYGDTPFKGYISNVRVIKGQSIFTGNVPGTTYFTPSTTPLTTSTVGATGSGVAGSLTGTVNFLGVRNNIFANTFVDDSSNAWPLTYWGGQLSAFTPFTSLRTNYSYVSVASGFDAAIAITTTGKLFSFGAAGYGTIGDNTNDIHRSYPIQIAIGSPTGALSYSVYFGRFVANYVYSPIDSGSTLGTSDHTIEFWCIFYSSNTTGMVWQYERNAAANATNKYFMQIGTSTSAIYLGNGTGYGLTITSTSNNVYTLVRNYWTHMAIVRSGNTFTWYVNGVSVGSGTYAANIPAQSTYGWQIGSNDAGNNQYGAISNFRVVVGQALYTGNFKPSTSPLTTSTVGATGAGAAATLTGTVPVLLFNTSNALYNAGTGPQLLKSGTYYEPIADYVNTPFSQQTFPAVLPNYAYSSITQIASGQYHYVVLTSNGSVYTWGYNQYGQLGQRNESNRSFPVQLLGSVASPTTYSVRIYDGSDYIILPSSLASTTGMGVGFAGNIVTMEMFIYPFFMDGTSYNLINCWWGGGSGGRWTWGYGPGSSYANATNLYFRWTTAASNTTITTTSYLVKWMQWNHVAITIDATTAASATIKFFVNGAVADTFTGQDLSAQTSHAALVSGGAWYLFTQPSGYSTFYGYASNCRIVRDVLVYTGAYTVPTSNLTNTQSADTNISAITAGQTALLTLQNATIIDNSYNNYTLVSNTTGTPARALEIVSDVVPFSTGTITYSSFSQVYATKDSSLIVNAVNGTLWGWGRNTTGELGLNNTNDYWSPVQLSAYQYIYQTKVSSPVQVQAGSSFVFVNTRAWSTAAVPYPRSTTLWMWGRNIEGQLNTNDTVSRSSPVQMAQNPVGLSVSFAVLGTGVSSIVGLGVYAGSNGLMFAAGGALTGQMGDNTTVAKSVAIQINTGTMNPLLYPKPTTGSNWSGSYTQIQINQYTATVIDNTNKIYAWGNNAYGGLARPGTGSGVYDSPVLIGLQTPPSSASPVQIVGSWGAVSAGTRHTLALNSSNNMYVWGADPAVKGVSWKSISSNDAALYGVRSDGTLWGSGYQVAGDPRLGDGTTIARSSPVQIPGSWAYVAAGHATAAGIRTNGTLWTWGPNTVGQLGDGTVVGPKSSPVQVAGGGSWATVAAGRSHWVGIKTDGTMWGWGNGANGQLGMGYSGAAAHKSSPTQIIANNLAGTDVATLPFPTTWSKVSCGDYSTYAVSNVGDLWVFGYNNIGQLGLNDTVDRSNPVQLMAGAGIIDITAGGPGSTTTHVIKGDGTLWGWGLNDYGQIGDGTGLYRSSPVQIGTSNWISLSLNGNLNRYAVRADGTIWGWGLNNYGQLLDGTVTHRSSPVQLPTSFNPLSTYSNKWLMTATWSTTGNTNWWTGPTGELYGIGQNRFGELGVGTTNQSYQYSTYGAIGIPGFSTSSPVQIGSDTWSSINAGNDFNLATNGSNALFAWGLNTSYQVGANSSMNVVSSPVQIGTSINLIAANTLGGYLPQ